MAHFNEAYTKTLGHEGGYVNDPNDRGGETYKGISRKNWPKWSGWVIFDQIVFDEESPVAIALENNKNLQQMVQAFYKIEFWNKVNGDAFPQAIAEELFDTAVNQGRIHAVSCLQKALNKLNRNERDYNDIIVDGQMGGQTLEAFNSYNKTAAFSTRSLPMLRAWLLKWMNYYQLQRYDELSNRHPEQEIYIFGWTNRA